METMNGGKKTVKNQSVRSTGCTPMLSVVNTIKWFNGKSWQLLSFASGSGTFLLPFSLTPAMSTESKALFQMQMMHFHMQKRIRVAPATCTEVLSFCGPLCLFKTAHECQITDLYSNDLRGNEHDGTGQRWAAWAPLLTLNRSHESSRHHYSDSKELTVH